MVTEGSVLEAFPDSPVSTAVLSDLEDSDEIITAIPIMSESHDGQELTDRIVIQTKSVAIVAVHDDDGWTVDHRVDGTDRDPSDVFEEAMILGQGDSPLVDAPDKA